MTNMLAPFLYQEGSFTRIFICERLLPFTILLFDVSSWVQDPDLFYSFDGTLDCT